MTKCKEQDIYYLMKLIEKTFVDEKNFNFNLKEIEFLVIQTSKLLLLDNGKILDYLCEINDLERAEQVIKYISKHLKYEGLFERVMDVDKGENSRTFKLCKANNIAMLNLFKKYRVYGIQEFRKIYFEYENSKIISDFLLETIKSHNIVLVTIKKHGINILDETYDFLYYDDSELDFKSKKMYVEKMLQIKPVTNPASLYHIYRTVIKTQIKDICEDLRLPFNYDKIKKKIIINISGKKIILNDIPQIYTSNKLNDILLVASANGDIETLTKILKEHPYIKPLKIEYNRNMDDID